MANQGKRKIDQLLADSFKELACQQPVEKITIKEITDRAGVIRTTFYNHFQDKYELLEWIINHDLIEPIKPFIRSGLTTQAMTFLFINVEKEKSFIQRSADWRGRILLTVFRKAVFKICWKRCVWNTAPADSRNMSG
ncbi:hypothetical protein C823_004699 [Eubacterium plexicaudatum ASF492]|nr:hypothetical protein C823_004699 [Eubacterium plexicaudatum ASF492]